MDFKFGDIVFETVDKYGQTPLFVTDVTGDTVTVIKYIPDSIYFGDDTAVYMKHHLTK